MSDINTAVVESLKVLDPKRPIREADIALNDLLKPKNEHETSKIDAMSASAALC